MFQLYAVLSVRHRLQQISIRSNGLAWPQSWNIMICFLFSRRTLSIYEVIFSDPKSSIPLISIHLCSSCFTKSCILSDLLIFWENAFFCFQIMLLLSDFNWFLRKDNWMPNHNNFFCEAPLLRDLTYFSYGFIHSCYTRSVDWEFHGTMLWGLALPASETV